MTSKQILASAQPSGRAEAETVQGLRPGGWGSGKAKAFTISLPFLYQDFFTISLPKLTGVGRVPGGAMGPERSGAEEGEVPER
jgi:hypothetical protein